MSLEMRRIDTNHPCSHQVGKCHIRKHICKSKFS